MPHDPKQPTPRVLSNDESAPDWFVREFCDQAVRRFREEIADAQGRDPIQEEQAQLRVVDALAGEFQQSAGSRDWTIAEQRVRQLAGDAIGLSLEFQHDHGYQPELGTEAASQDERATAAAEAAPGDRGQPRTRGGGER